MHCMTTWRMHGLERLCMRTELCVPMISSDFGHLDHMRVGSIFFCCCFVVCIRIRMHLELCSFHAHVFDLYAVCCVIPMGTYVDFCILIIGTFALYYYGLCYLISMATCLCDVPTCFFYGCNLLCGLGLGSVRQAALRTC